MNKARWVSAAAGTAVLVAGFALPASAAFADSGPNGNGNAGVLSILSGNTVNAPVSAPVNICGIAVALLGGANAGCAGGASSNTTVNGSGPGGGNGNGNAGSTAIGSGNTVNAPVSAPVNTCGISVADEGFSNSRCKGGSASNTTINGSGSGGGNGNGNAGSTAIGSGNTVNAPVSAPSDVCGIALAMLGFANAGCKGGAASNTTINGSGSGGGNGNGNAGVLSELSGNTVNAPVSAPVNTCGIALADLGFANARCKGGAASNTTTSGSPGSGGNGNGNGGVISTGSGNTVNAPVSAPTNTCGISLAMLGFSNAGCQGGSVSNVNTPPGGGGGTPPGGGGTPPGTQGGGTQGGGTQGSGTQGSGTTTTVPGSLPITGADLLGLVVVTAGALGIGGASLVIARRRRNSAI